MSKDGCMLFGTGPVLPVKDIVSAVNYYCEELGFALDLVHGDPPTHGSVTRCSVGIQFTPAPGGFEASDYPGWVYVFVDGIDDLFEEYRGRNVTITKEIESYGYGMREFEVKDLDGNRLRFGAYLNSLADSG
ncbi:MAG: glyoxalase superfamily protein [Dehalococcoidia bacterium]